MEATGAKLRKTTADAGTGEQLAGGAASDVAPGDRLYRYRNEQQVPELRLGGKWLRRAGFDLGQKVAVKVDERRLTISAA